MFGKRFKLQGLTFLNFSDQADPEKLTRLFESFMKREPLTGDSTDPVAFIGCNDENRWLFKLVATVTTFDEHERRVFCTNRGFMIFRGHELHVTVALDGDFGYREKLQLSLDQDDGLNA